MAGTKTTQSDVTHAFNRLRNAAGWRLAKEYNDVGGYALDRATLYGGTRIIQIVSHGGGVRDVTGRMSPAQFVASCNFSLDVLSEMSREAEKC